VVTKWVEGTPSEVVTQHYCSKLHMALDTLTTYAAEQIGAGSKILRQMSRVALNVTKKMVQQAEKEWKAAK
jgi:hypothetical protein